MRLDKASSCLLSRTVWKALFNICALVALVWLWQQERYTNNGWQGRIMCIWTSKWTSHTTWQRADTSKSELIKRKMSCLRKVAGLGESEAEQGLSLFSHIRLLCPHCVFFGILVWYEKCTRWAWPSDYHPRCTKSGSHACPFEEVDGAHIIASLALLTYFTTLLCISFSPSVFFFFIFFIFFISHTSLILPNTFGFSLFNDLGHSLKTTLSHFHPQHSL